MVDGLSSVELPSTTDGMVLSPAVPKLSGNQAAIAASPAVQRWLTSNGSRRFITAKT
jgi:hypothetical protein